MNTNFGAWFAGMFMVWLVTFLFTEPSIHPYSVVFAEEVCKDNGGWKVIEEGRVSKSSVKCINGATFEYLWEKLPKEDK